MKTVNTLAWANTKYNKGKNILSGIAIALTTLLVFLIISIGLGTVNTRNYVVNQTYPTWHAMYRDVSEKNKNHLVLHNDIERYGLRQDVGETKINDSAILISYLDKSALQLNKIKFSKGSAPKAGNEVALSMGALKLLGYTQPKLGTEIEVPFQPYEGKGLGYEQQAKFVLTGILPENNNEAKTKLYSMFVSQDFMAQVIPKKERSYRVMVRIAGAQSMVTDDIEEAAKEIGSSFDISANDVVINSDYLGANYVDPATNMIITAVIIVILLAGAMTIYSIYYVSLINKVHEFGKLKALGATKRQIRQAVLRENLIVACIGISLGLVLGAATVKVFFNILLGSLLSVDASMALMKQAINSGAVQLVFPWVLSLTALAVLLMVILSSLKPMRQASKIMPVEAMNYTGQSKKQKQSRKGYFDLNPRKLAAANLSRNKKRTLITIISLGILGVLFMTLSTIFTCMQPAQIADDSIVDDFQLSIDSAYDDKMHPEQTWSKIQQKNPLNQALLSEIAQLDGVEKVTAHQDIDVEVPALKESGEALSGSIHGITKAQVKEVQQYLEQGKASYEDLLSGDKVMAGAYLARNYPEIKVGEAFNLTIFDGDKTYQKKLTIAAIGDFPPSIEQGTFFMANEAVQELSQNNLTYSVDIKAKKSQKKAINTQLKKIVADNDYLIMDSFDNQLADWQGTQRFYGGITYGIMMILGLVGIMNLVNTTINSIVIRKKELGIMQAIGMSDRQLRRMLQSEGLFYSLGIVLVTVLFGSLGGYGIFSYAVNNGHLMQIYTFHYPVVQLVSIIAIVIAVEIVLTLVTTKVINKETIIDRIHTSE